MTRPPTRGMIAALMIAAAFSLGGCAGAVIGAGATAGTAAVQERGLDGAIVDSRIQATLNNGWLEYDKNLFPHLASSVYEGRVLLTGVVKTEDQRAEIVRQAWAIRGVREVINELLVDPGGTTGTFARDSWISTQLRTKLLFDRDVLAINYSVETVRHTVYLFGVAQDKQELDRVINYARNIEYVSRVVNHVLLKSDPRRRA
jgi:osmotically-inducible protein OsmY